MRPSHALGVSLVLAVAAAVAAVCPSRPPAGPATAPVVAAAVADLTQRDLRAVRALRAATVRVNLPEGHGSGLCRRASDGTVWVWTAGHVADHAKVPPRGLSLPGKAAFVPLTVTHFGYTADDRPADRVEYEAVVVRLDASRDIALLRLTSTATRCGSLDFAETPPDLLTPVLCCGSPRGFDGTVTRGVVNFHNRETPFGPFDQTDAPSVGGNSGGPVATQTPAGLRVAGLVSGGVGESFTCIVPARVIRAFAAEEGLLHAFEGDAPPPANPPDRPIEVARP